MDGILLINKEKGPTSFGVIEQIKRRFRVEKIGHSGTLDPLATGLLMVLVGRATKVNEYLPDSKVYEMEITFGKSTNTDDAEGEIIKEIPVPGGLEELVKKALPSFTGDITQIPPKFSAIKKDGVKLYDLARAGREVNPEPRQVRIDSIELISSGTDSVNLRVACGSGTYMRSLARDLGEKIGSCAFLSGLVRTKIGEFSITQSHKIEEIEDLNNALIPITSALINIPALALNQENYGRIKNGMTIDSTLPYKSGYCLLTYENQAAAIGQIKYGKIYVKRGI
jgi:tRNA pseudouridine55 synthase